MKVLSTDGLTKLIDLVKSSFISKTDTEEVTEIDTETISEVTLATVATTGAYSDLSGTPTIPTVDQTYDGTSVNAQSGVAVASAISGKANTDLSNISGTSTSCIDGQWVPLNVTIANSVSWNSSSTDATYNIANYLPNDSYQYEVLISALVTTAASANKFCTISLTSDIQTSTVYVASIRTVANVAANQAGAAIIPVGTGRTITQYSTTSSNANGSYSIYLKGYRRIGTNS